MDSIPQKPIDEIRQEKLRKLQTLEDQKVLVFPSVPQFKLTSIQESREQNLDTEVAVAGRIMSIRGHGGIRFADLKDQTARIQLSFRKDQLSAQQFKLLNLIDVGDFVAVQGRLFLTQSQELTIQVHDFQFLAKAIRPLPDQRVGLQDKETRLRKRYLDLLLNQTTQDVFRVRHQLTRSIRHFLDQEGFTEVETPILQPLYGGANAQPFTTRINALDTQAYLRIAPELYLKKLVVSGLEKIYELAKDFRNEGIDQTHFPEFTMLEAYLSYADYQQMMDLMETLLRYLTKQILKSNTLRVLDQTIRLDQSWPRIPMTDLIRDMTHLDVLTATAQKITDHTFQDIYGKNHQIGEELTQCGIDFTKLTKGELIFAVFDKLIFLKNPTWVIDYPIEVSPLAKTHRAKPGFTERFELYIGGKEIMDGWTEINDPRMQRSRFEAEQTRMFDQTETAQPIDEDYLEAMEYGMPPMAGVGVGIDRLTMLFTNQWSIQETILFPFKKPL